MQVILKENIENLGRIGDLIKVSDGYARNFLLPRGLVFVANSKQLALIAHQKRILEKKRRLQIASAQELVERLEGFSCKIVRKAGENDKLFGSVTSADIAEQLQKGGFLIDRRHIDLSGPIKALGEHAVAIKLDPDVRAQMKVWVVKEE